MNDEKNAQNAHKNAPNQPNKGGESARESKLDQWIRQNVLGEHKPEEKIIHEPAPQTGGQGQKAPVKPDQKPPKKRGFFFGRRDKGGEGDRGNKAPAPHAPQPGRPGKPEQAGKQGWIHHPTNVKPFHALPPKPLHPAKAAPAAKPTQPGKPMGKPQKGGGRRGGRPEPKSRFEPRVAKGETAKHGGFPGGHSAARPPASGHRGQGLYAPTTDAQKAAFHAQRAVKDTRQYKGLLRVIPLGGLDEVGKNCMAFEYCEQGFAKGIPNGPSDIMVIDLGFQFPDEDMLGVDYVIPDTSYLMDKLDRIKGIVFTHGHLDHIGAVPYLIQKLGFPPMYGTRLTMGLVDKRLEEFGLQKEANVNIIKAEDTLKLGTFDVSFFPVNHSIPDAVGVLVKTPAGNIVHTGDFKFDFTPAGGQNPADFAAIAALSFQDVAALFIDSTNALKPGYTVSEKQIGESLESIIKNVEGRIVIASFASQIGRMQQIIDFARKYDRSIFLSGRSLIDNVFMAHKLGYLKMPEGLVQDIRKAKKIPNEKVLILTTGSQGESVSALTRMSTEEHPSIQIMPGDTVVLSSSPIPGNERPVATVTNNLCRLGARVINNKIMDVHASGHAQQEDLKLMMSLVKPKYVVPIHGEFYMRYGTKELAMGLGYDDAHAVMVENGDVIEIENGEIVTKGEKVPSNYILIDGLGVGDVGAQVIMDRQTLAENGVLITIIPVDEHSRKLKGEVEVISRGFIYMKEGDEVVNEIKKIAADSYRDIVEKRADLKRAEVKKFLRETLDKFVHRKIERHPLIIPIVVET
jgi:ribonuclease J